MNGLVPLSAPLSLVPSGRLTETKISRIEQYGMTLWFDVIVHTGGAGVADLGSWSSCSELEVKFDTERFKVGGNYGAEAVLPGRLGFKDITLQRAMTGTDSAAVRRWLESVGRTWLNGSGQASWDRANCSATIKVFSGPGATTPIAEWTLRNVTPVSWSAPQLSTTGGGVAIEKLVLAHDGFLPVGGEDQPAALTLTQAKDGTSVVFPHLPDSVQVEKSVELENAAGLNQMLYDPKMTKPGRTGITLGELLLDGAEIVTKNVDQLWKWLEPVAASSGKTGSDFGPQVLDLKLGTSTNGLRRNVIITKVDVNYVRFDRTGRPTRATVRLTLQVAPDAWARGSTPSGGRAGALTAGAHRGVR